MKKSIFAICILISAVCIPSSQSLAQSRKAVSGAEVTGTFRNRQNSEFMIQALGRGKLKIEFSGLYTYKMANGEMMANTGEAAGEAIIEGDTAIFTPDYSKEANAACTITLKFTKPGTIVVTQEETEVGCGFGHNVTAQGTYRKISNQKPKFN